MITHTRVSVIPKEGIVYVDIECGVPQWYSGFMPHKMGTSVLVTLYVTGVRNSIIYVLKNGTIVKEELGEWIWRTDRPHRVLPSLLINRLLYNKHVIKPIIRHEYKPIISVELICDRKSYKWSDAVWGRHEVNIFLNKTTFYYLAVIHDLFKLLLPILLILLIKGFRYESN